jgi:hypothetical protein
MIDDLVANQRLDATHTTKSLFFFFLTGPLFQKIGKVLDNLASKKIKRKDRRCHQDCAVSASCHFERFRTYLVMA